MPYASIQRKTPMRVERKPDPWKRFSDRSMSGYPSEKFQNKSDTDAKIITDNPTADSCDHTCH